MHPDEILDIEETWRRFKQTGSAGLREALILNYAHLVNEIAGHIYFKLPPDLEYTDLVGYGFLGLLDAIDKFDPDRGNGFPTYARIRISGAIIDGIRSDKRLPRSIQHKMKKLNGAQDALSAQLHRFPTEEEIARHLDIDVSKYREILTEIGHSNVLSLDDLILNSDNGDSPLNLLDSLRDESSLEPSEFLERESIREVVREAVNHLPEREKIVLSLYYFEDLNMKEISEVLDITESRVSQLHHSAIRRLKPYLSARIDRQPA